MPFKIAILFITITLFWSCSKEMHPAKGPDKLVIYPAPPDTARIQFLTKISSSSDVSGSRRGFKKFILGAEEVRTIGKPYGIALYKGKIYICDTFKRGFDIIDLEKNTFREFIPDGAGALKVPLNCAFDGRGYLYVADADRKQIVVFDEKGNYVTCFGEKENFKPTDIFITGGKIYVVNLAGHQVQIYSSDSLNRLLGKFPEPQIGTPGYLFSPTNIYVSESRVYVTDFGDYKVKIFDNNGVFADTVGTYGENLGQFARPKGIAVDHESNMYVVDAGFENTQIFNKAGKLLMFFGGNYKGPGDMWLPAKVAIDYDHLNYFQKYVDPRYQLKYLILVTNQFGPDKLNIYGAIEPKTPDKKAK